METKLNHRTKVEPSASEKMAAVGPSVTPAKPSEVHPAGEAKHGEWMQFFRKASLAVYFGLSCIAILATQLIGSPLYWYDRDLYYKYMAHTKESFALLSMSVTEWWGPTVIRISGDASVADQIHRTEDGRVEFTFPERLVLIANHQIYTDWSYLWWAGYANSPHMHGNLYIILKESLKWIPIMGMGMMFFSFIFMSRKMEVDQHRMAYRLQKLKQERTVDGKKVLGPMWLLLFPEGTNITNKAKMKSAEWAEKNKWKVPQHVLLPRSTGAMFCLKELRGTVEYIYDCTVAYEGIPRGGCGEDYFTLSSTYFQGRPPKSVNLHWRRFRVSDIPLDDAKLFDAWLRERFYEKDQLMEEYLNTGRFPPLEGCKKDYVETEVRSKYPWEFLQIYAVLIGVWFVKTLAVRMWKTVFYGAW